MSVLPWSCLGVILVFLHPDIFESRNRNRSKNMKLKRFDDKSENIMKYKNAKSRKILVRGILQSQLVPFNIAFGISFPNPLQNISKMNGIEMDLNRK